MKYSNVVIMHGSVDASAPARKAPSAEELPAVETKEPPVLRVLVYDHASINAEF